MNERESQPRHVVVLVHGIRTQAEWQQMVAATLEGETDLEVIPTRYEYLDVLRFLLPVQAFRRPSIRRIKEILRDVMSEEPPPKVSVVAHSFGSYILGSILSQELDIKLHRIILCGSIMPDQYPWHHFPHNRIEQVVNECGWHDIWPVLAKSSTWGYGASGAFGFGSPRVRDRFHDFRHGDFFDENFVRTYWIPFLVEGTVSTGRLDRPKIPWWLSMLTVVQLKYLAIAAFVSLGFFALVLPMLATPHGVEGELAGLFGQAHAQATAASKRADVLRDQLVGSSNVLDPPPPEQILSGLERAIEVVDDIARRQEVVEFLAPAPLSTLEVNVANARGSLDSLRQELTSPTALRHLDNLRSNLHQIHNTTFLHFLLAGEKISFECYADLFHRVATKFVRGQSAQQIDQFVGKWDMDEPPCLGVALKLQLTENL